MTMRKLWALVPRIEPTIHLAGYADVVYLYTSEKHAQEVITPGDDRVVIPVWVSELETHAEYGSIAVLLEYSPSQLEGFWRFVREGHLGVFEVIAFIQYLIRKRREAEARATLQGDWIDTGPAAMARSWKRYYALYKKRGEA